MEIQNSHLRQLTLPLKQPPEWSEAVQVDLMVVEPVQRSNQLETVRRELERLVKTLGGQVRIPEVEMMQEAREQS